MSPLPKTIRKPKGRIAFDPQAFLTTVGMARTITQCQKNHRIFSLGEPAEAIFYIQKGRVKITVTSKRGREAVIAILGPSNFFGEGCIAGQAVRMATATAIAPSSILRIEKNEMLRVLQEEHSLSGLFISHLVTRNIRIEADLVDQLFNSTEKRLARALVLLSHYGKESKLESVVPEVNQQILAAMIGTTRSRVSFFMNKFRKLGFIKYNGGLQVRSSLQNVVLHEGD